MEYGICNYWMLKIMFSTISINNYMKQKRKEKKQKSKEKELWIEGNDLSLVSLKFHFQLINVD